MATLMMNKIFYFSGTGNSQYVAQKVSERLEYLTKTTLISISDAMKKDEYGYDLLPGESVGIVCPIYFWGLPSIVVDFIGKLELKGYSSESNSIYIIFTCGGSVGLSDSMAAKCLKRRSYLLNAAFSIKMPDNYCIMFDFMTPLDKIEPILRQAEDRMVKVASAVSDLCSVYGEGNRLNAFAGMVTRYKGESLLNRGPFPWMATTFSYPVYRSGRKTKPFNVLDVCVGCGTCAKVCPVEKIHMADGAKPSAGKSSKRPVWEEGQCVQCLACLHHCPVRAIQYGKKTLKRGRYLFPESC